MTDIMVDTETTGTRSAYSGIIQLAGVKFNLETQEVGEFFDRCPGLLPNRFWDEGTKQFWRQQPVVLNKIVSREEDPEQVYVDFSKWVSSDAPSNGYRFWAKPITFDWGMLASHYEQLGRPMPFHYRYARDMNSWISARKGLTGDHVDMSFCEAQHTGAAHDALSDCLLQLRQLFSAANGVFHEILPA